MTTGSSRTMQNSHAGRDTYRRDLGEPVRLTEEDGTHHATASSSLEATARPTGVINPGGEYVPTPVCRCQLEYVC